MEINSVQTRQAYVRAADNAINEESRTVQFVISSEAVDSYNTVFRMDGWDLDEYTRNPIVCYNHNVHGSNPDTIIGTSRVFKEGDLLIGEVTFEDAETNKLAEKVFRKVKNGTLRMASINAVILNGRMGNKDQAEDPEVVYFTRQKLQEWSVVSIGANPDAAKRNTSHLEEIRTAITKENKVDASKEEVPNEMRSSSFDAFDAQYMFNQNS